MTMRTRFFHVRRGWTVEGQARCVGCNGIPRYIVTFFMDRLSVVQRNLCEPCLMQLAVDVAESLEVELNR